MHLVSGFNYARLKEHSLNTVKPMTPKLKKGKKRAAFKQEHAKIEVEAYVC